MCMICDLILPMRAIFTQRVGCTKRSHLITAATAAAAAEPSRLFPTLSLEPACGAGTQKA